MRQTVRGLSWGRIPARRRHQASRWLVGRNPGKLSTLNREGRTVMIFRWPSSARLPLSLLPAATVVVTAGIFVADAASPPESVVSGLYVVVVLMAGRFWNGTRLWFVAGGCAVLTIVAQFLASEFVPDNDPSMVIGAFNSLVTLVALGLSTHLVQHGQAAEAALFRAQSDLAHVSRVTTMGELTASIAHEVNQPITGVVTNAGACLRWLTNDPPDLERARAAAHRIVRDGQRAAEIISRIRRIFVKGSRQREPIDVNQLLRETAELLRSEVNHNGISIRTDLAADVPEVLADRVQVQQVLVNLIMNGVDATRDVIGPRELVVSSCRRDDEHVLISVSDTGVGLPAEQVNQLFDAFFTTKSQGTGMGLSISRSIIDAHEGQLWAAPNEPRGATFLFTLPFKPRW
jgi:signal transduction histidine kinase